MKGKVYKGRIYCFDEDSCIYEFDENITSCVDNCPYYKDYHKPKQDNSWALTFEVLEE